MPQWVAFCTARENLKSTGTVSVHADNVDIQAASLASLLPWHRVRPCPAIYFKPANTHALCLTPVSRAQNTNPGRTMGEKKKQRSQDDRRHRHANPLVVFLFRRGRHTKDALAVQSARPEGISVEVYHSRSTIWKSHVSMYTRTHTLPWHPLLVKSSQFIQSDVPFWPSSAL